MERRPIGRWLVLLAALAVCVYGITKASGMGSYSCDRECKNSVGAVPNSSGDPNAPDTLPSQSSSAGTVSQPALESSEGESKSAGPVLNQAPRPAVSNGRPDPGKLASTGLAGS